MTAGGRRSPPTGLGLAAASIVHDANNRLTAIIAVAETTLRRPGLDADIAAELRHIRQEAHRAAAMLRGLLAPGARTAATSRRYLQLDPIVQAISASLRRLLGPRSRVDLMLGCGTESVWLDPDALHDALLNLAANARDAMAEDGVLTLQTSLVDIASALAGVPQSVPPGRYAVIEVADNGGGVPPQVMQRLCEPFFTTKPLRRGSGLGLHSVRATMRRHDGFITLASSPAEGTRVSLFLPRGERRSPIGGGRLVLLVEDEPAVRRYEARLLADNGWRVQEADDGRTALGLLRRAKSERPCLLICDLALPDMGGSELIRAARQICPGLPAIVVSGYLADEVTGIEHARFLRKPFRAAALLELAAELAPLTGQADAGSID